IKRASATFIPHSQYSILDATLSKPALVKKTKEWNETEKKRSSNAFHITLLAKNSAGYANLVKLSSIGFIEGFYYIPRIDIELLKIHNEGLICLSGCIKSPFTHAITTKNPDLLRFLIEEFKTLFKEDFFFVLQRHSSTREDLELDGTLDESDLNITIEKALEKDLLNLYETDNDAKSILILDKALEGSIRNTGIHAAGLIFSGKPLMENVPVATSKDSDMFVTHYSMKPVEMVGMLKIDFLGLKTLTSIQIAIDAIYERLKIKIDWINLDLDDLKTFEILNLPPDINEYGINFTFTGRGIRFALSAINGVGALVVDTSLNQNFNGLFTNLYGVTSAEVASHRRSKEELLFKEKAISGLFISGHPLHEYATVLQKVGTISIQESINSSENSVFRLNFVIESMTVKYQMQVVSETEIHIACRWVGSQINRPRNSQKRVEKKK
ncbi:hypothetical protein ACTFIW_007684, partial [Dictyostelium discoideum]